MTEINWRAVAEAEVHPLRLRILRAVGDQGETSPVDLARETGESVQLVSYHVRQLAENGLIHQTRTEPRRGALQHYYELTNGAVLPREVASVA